VVADRALADLTAVVVALDGLTPDARFTLGRPSAPGWSTLEDAVTALRRWHATDLEVVPDRRLAAMTLGAALCSAPTVLIAAPAVLGGVVVDVEPRAVRVRRSASGGLDGSAIAPSTVRTSGGALPLAAARVAELVTPLVTRVAAALPVGARALWGAAADALGAQVLAATRQRGDDGAAMHTRVTGFYDVLERSVPQLVRPSALPVDWTGGTAWFQTRGTCCLRYRAVPEVPVADAYCSTCPLRGSESSADVIGRYLDAAVGGH
jgi:hypothetical protein